MLMAWPIQECTEPGVAQEVDVGVRPEPLLPAEAGRDGRRGADGDGRLGCQEPGSAPTTQHHRSGVDGWAELRRQSIAPQ